MKAPDTQIALTLYTVREHCQTADDLDRTLGTLKDIGYEAIQISGVPLPPRVIGNLANSQGLHICAAHENLPDLRNNFDAVLEKLKTWECDFTALGHPGDAFTVDPTGAGKLIAEMEGYAQRFAAHNIQFAYHNHHGEFERAGDDIFIERLVKETSTLLLEIDVHWVQRGGQSPSDWIHKVAGRMPVCHFKDFSILNSEPQFCEVGEGNLDWNSIIQACKQTAVRWYVVEQDAPIEGRSIFESLAISFKNLRKMAVV